MSEDNGTPVVRSTLVVSRSTLAVARFGTVHGFRERAATRAAPTSLVSMPGGIP